MKKQLLVLPLIAAGAYFTLSSNSSGYPANRTGSDGVSSTTGCGGSGCHGSSASPATVAVMTIIVDSAGTPVTHYTPGSTYRVSMYGGAASSANLHKFGFQLSGVKTSDNSQAGNFLSASLPPEASLNTFSGRQVVSHNTPKNDSVTAVGSAYPVQVSWTAPAAGSGNVKFYGVINAVTNDGSATSADKWNTVNVTITELVDHTAVSDVKGGVSIKATPNPVISSLNLELVNAAAGKYDVKVYDMSGKVIANDAINVNTNANTTINMVNIAPGMYQVVVEKDGVRTVTPIVKQ